VKNPCHLPGGLGVAGQSSNTTVGAHLAPGNCTDYLYRFFGKGGHYDLKAPVAS
jgi:hypothetical protein